MLGAISSWGPALTVALASASLVSAHTAFTTLFINGKNQGDGTCVRMPMDPDTATDPVENLASNDMACGVDGEKAVNFTCGAPAGATLTFEFREWPDLSQPGSIDISHKGPCAVYLKQVSDMASSSAPGDGWFKIWDQGYDDSTGKWCTEKLIDNSGLLSIALPEGLPTGYYLARPELLALHEANVGDPQFYVGCAQLFVQGDGGAGTLAVPSANQATIPGYVKAGDPSVSFNIYEPTWPYPMPGPSVFFPTSSSSSKAKERDAGATQTQGLIPSGCLLKNANWCGLEVGSYGDEDGCWAASQACFDQEAACYSSAPPTGDANCGVWDTKCTGIQDACNAGSFTGPPNAGQTLDAIEAAVPGPLPAAENGDGSSSSNSGGDDGSDGSDKEVAADPTNSFGISPSATASLAASGDDSSAAPPAAAPPSAPTDAPGDGSSFSLGSASPAGETLSGQGPPSGLTLSAGSAGPTGTGFYVTTLSHHEKSTATASAAGPAAPTTLGAGGPGGSGPGAGGPGTMPPSPWGKANSTGWGTGVSTVSTVPKATVTVAGAGALAANLYSGLALAVIAAAALVI